MATLYVTEFNDQGKGPYGRGIPVAAQPVLAEQTVSISSGSSSSAGFQTTTNLIRLHSDAICSFEFGTSPTASATTARMAANQTEYFTVPQGAVYKVAVITNS